MTAYTAHGKMTRALKKVSDVNLVAMPNTITITNIIRAKTDESKRNLVRAARFVEREIVSRELNSEGEI